MCEYQPYRRSYFGLVSIYSPLDHFIDSQQDRQAFQGGLPPGGKAALFKPNSFYLIDIIWQVWITIYSVIHDQLLMFFAILHEWWDFLENGGSRGQKSYTDKFVKPHSINDWQWYFRHLQKQLNHCAAQYLPFNLSNHFLFICILNT